MFQNTRTTPMPEKTRIFIPSVAKTIFQNLKMLMTKLFYILIFSLGAQESAFSNSETASKPNALEQFFPFILVGLFFYFILIKPQQKKQKNQNTFLSNLKEGEEVLTSSGIYGKVLRITGDFVILEVDENTQIRVVKSFISSYTQKKNPVKEYNTTSKKDKNKKIKI